MAGAALTLAGAAAGVGPWPGLAATVTAPSGEVRYTATRGSGSTLVRAIRSGKVVASTRIDGAYGIPAVTSNGRAGGLSPDGRLLVLGQPPSYDGLRRQSSFAVVSTAKLTLARLIVLPGEFGFDAISPGGRILYLIQHAAAADLIRYVVRAYDLRAGRLLPGAIVDPREPGEPMRGYPVSRATSARGAWVYTLYQRGAGKPFIHALNASGRTAFCIDLPWSGSTDDVWQARLELVDGDGRLVVRDGAGERVSTVDTKTLRVL